MWWSPPKMTYASSESQGHQGSTISTFRDAPLIYFPSTSRTPASEIPWELRILSFLQGGWTYIHYIWEIHGNPWQSWLLNHQFWCIDRHSTILQILQPVTQHCWHHVELNQVHNRSTVGCSRFCVFQASAHKCRTMGAEPLINGL